MAADEQSTPGTHHSAPLAPLPDHRNVNTAWWQELWRRHAHITTPLRERGLKCDIEFGLSTYIVRAQLADDSYLIVSPPQEPLSERPPGDPEGWIAFREPLDDQSSFEVFYDSAPSDGPSAVHRPEVRNGSSVQPLIAAIDHHLAQLGLLPHPLTSPEAPHPPPAAATIRPPAVPDCPDADRAIVYTYGDALRALTDQLNGAASHADAAALLHQVLEPTNGLLAQLGEFFEAAEEKAKEAEEKDGFELSYDFADAAAEMRNLTEVLHAAEDRMRVLTSPAPAPRLPSTAAGSPSRPLRVPPPTQPRHTR
ncbi:hypothetical protein [Streptomyces sp. NPDC006285]|uniref:hypothetical protein n=1 Tax=Streptomyces sp. NPDC006285 TaxID=3364742 RepID=UPI0036AB0B98